MEQCIGCPAESSFSSSQTPHYYSLSGTLHLPWRDLLTYGGDQYRAGSPARGPLPMEAWMGERFTVLKVCF